MLTIAFKYQLVGLIKITKQFCGLDNVIEKHHSWTSTRYQLIDNRK